MRELQGGIIASAVFIVFLGASGLLTALLRFISPITGVLGLGSGPAHGTLPRAVSVLSHCSRQHGGSWLPWAASTLCSARAECGARAAVAVNIAIVGLSLYETGFSGVANCVQVWRAAPGAPGSAAAWRPCPSRALLGTQSFFTKQSGRGRDTGCAQWGEARERWPKQQRALRAGMRACGSAALRMRAHTNTDTYPRAGASDAPPARGAAWPTDDCSASYLLAVPAAVRAAHPARRQVRPRAAVAAALPAPQPHLSRALASTPRRGPRRADGARGAEPARPPP